MGIFPRLLCLLDSLYSDLRFFEVLLVIFSSLIYSAVSVYVVSGSLFNAVCVSGVYTPFLFVNGFVAKNPVVGEGVFTGGQHINEMIVSRFSLNVMNNFLTLALVFIVSMLGLLYPMFSRLRSQGPLLPFRLSIDPSIIYLSILGLSLISYSALVSVFLACFGIVSYAYRFDLFGYTGSLHVLLYIVSLNLLVTVVLYTVYFLSGRLDLAVITPSLFITVLSRLNSSYIIGKTGFFIAVFIVASVLIVATIYLFIRRRVLRCLATGL